MRVGLALVSLLAACAADGDVVDVGVLAFGDEAPRITVPDAPVGTGKPFVVSVDTLGGGCIRFERTDIVTTDTGADLMPYDREHVPRSRVCTAELAFLHHDASFVFETTGPKEIHIHGRRGDTPVVISIPIDVVD